MDLKIDFHYWRSVTLKHVILQAYKSIKIKNKNARNTLVYKTLSQIFKYFRESSHSFSRLQISHREAQKFAYIQRRRKTKLRPSKTLTNRGNVVTTIKNRRERGKAAVISPARFFFRQIVGSTSENALYTGTLPKQFKQRILQRCFIL